MSMEDSGSELGVMSEQPTVMEPELGSYKRCNNAAIVDFLDPEAPTIATHSPSRDSDPSRRRLQVAQGTRSARSRV